MTWTILAAEGFGADSGAGSLAIRYSGQAVWQRGGINDDNPRRPGGRHWVHTTTSTQNVLANNTRIATFTNFASLMAGKRVLEISFAARGNRPTTVRNGFMGLAGGPASSFQGQLGIYTFSATSNTTYLYAGSVSFNITGLFPTVGENDWRQIEIVFVSDEIGGITGTVYLYCEGELLLSESNVTIGNSTVETGLYISAQHVNNATGVIRVPHFTTTTDWVLATSDDPDERLGETYVDVLNPTVDVSIDGFTSSIGSDPIAEDVDKYDASVATPFIQATSAPASAEFSSGVQFPDDGRIVRAVTVVGAGQSNTATTTAIATLNGEEIGVAQTLSIGTQTRLNSLNLDWQNTDPVDDEPWAVDKINELTFGVKRLT